MHSKTLAPMLALAALLVAGIAAADRPTDAWITTKTKMALLTAPDVDGSRLNVDTVRGTVTLQGVVSTKAESDRAAEIAKTIEGVHGVRNIIQVVPPSEREATHENDEDIRKDIKARLRADSSLANSSIHVQSVHDGVAVLGGRASSLGDHRRALAVARRTPGVKRVVSEIRSPDRIADDEIWHPRNATTTPKRGVSSRANDMWITSAVKLRLLADSDTPGSDINVDTNDGTVTLFGIVPSESAKTAAAADARRVNDVQGVNNELEVVAPEHAEAVEARDEELLANVRQALKDDPDVHASAIAVEVKNGVVRLTGSVPSGGEKLDAALAARMVPGVRSVNEELQVRTSK